MDPNAAVQRFIDGLADGDLNEGVGGWLDYLDWTAKGGFEADPEILASAQIALVDWEARTGMTLAEIDWTALDALEGGDDEW